MLFMSLFIFMSSVFAQQTIPWSDSQFPCIDSARAQKYVRDFNINVRSFGGLELCNAQVDTKKLFNDLAIVELGKFNEDQSNVFIRGFVKNNQYYEWMKSQTRGMSRGQDIPYATAYNSGGYFTMQDGWSVLSTLGRVGTIVHEARHTAGYRHYACNQGPYQGANVSGCDSTYQAGGSHSVEMEYYARVSTQGVNFHPVYKTMARLMAIARSNAFFNEPVIQKKEGVIALPANRNESEFILDNQKMIRNAPSIPGVLKRTSFGAVVFDGAQAQSIELYGNDRFDTPILDGYSYFKLLLDFKSPVFDFEEFDIGTKRYVVRMRTPDSIEFFNFPRGEWSRPVQLNFKAVMTTTRLETNQKGFFLIDQNARIYPVNPENQTVGAPLQQVWNPTTVSVAYWNSTLLILKNDGSIHQRNQNRQTRVWPGAQGPYRGLINVPVYNGFEVKP